MRQGLLPVRIYVLMVEEALDCMVIDMGKCMNINSLQSNRIQVIRGIAIIAVICIHCIHGEALAITIRPFLNFSVGMFLFISGILTDKKRSNLIARIKRLIIPYLFWSMMYVIFYDYQTPENIPIDFLFGILTADAASIMYYVFVYCQLTLLIPVIEKVSESKYKYALLLISPIEVFVMRALPVLMGINVNPYVQIIMHISCVGWFSYYYFGYLLGNNLISIKIKQKYLYILWSVSILLQMIEGYIQYSVGVKSFASQLKLSALLTGIMSVMLAYRFIYNDKGLICYNWLKKVGDLSSGIFFAHLAVIWGLSLIPEYNTNIIFPLNAMCTLIVTYFLVLIIKKCFGNYSAIIGF